MESKNEIERKLYSDLAAKVADEGCSMMGANVSEDEAQEIRTGDAVFARDLLSLIGCLVAWKKISERLYWEMKTDAPYLVSVRIDKGKLDFRVGKA